MPCVVGAVLFEAACLGGPLTAQFKSAAAFGSSSTDQLGAPFTVQGVSGIVWNGPHLGGSGTDYLAVMDNSNKLVRLSVTLTADGSISSASLAGGVSIAESRDFEDVCSRGPARDRIFVCDEGGPDIREFDLSTGGLVGVLPRPGVFANRRANFGYESLSLSRTGSTLWTCNEEALTVDGNASSATAGSWVRLLKYDATVSPPQPVAQYAYLTQPLHGVSVSGSRSGVSQVVVLPNRKLLVLERSFALGSSFFLTRLYEVDVSAATDVSGMGSLAAATYVPATKRLLYSGDQTNLEGLCLGPALAAGGYALIGIVDDGDPISVNRVVSFRLTGDVDSPCPADLTDDGIVDDADFVRFAASYDLLLDPVGDLNQNGATDDDDFVLFAGAYDALVCP
ncbi:MAG: esterase-like activity of phytase family protein [Planctomycetes bacterium]|nr:esterase-like activity of phytase family protein [Planctomycetota bacterium]